MGILKHLKKQSENKIQEETKVVDPTIVSSQITEEAPVVEKTTVSKSKSSRSKKEMKIISDAVIIRPLVTEKASFLASQSQYLFEVKLEANRIQVYKSIIALYGVKPVSVNIVNMKGKRVRFGRTNGRRKDWKKAIVTIPKGKTIDVYEGV
ncbi:MAG: 50S ribosomal protein L23 [Candidatus Uhrbacteria bacterium GW2011_GWE2_40_58]|nr:MAG: 50S ribosomal protein L23 [Candidatus Uhrbacteria bacterium GW2011_GWF2_40_263]KKR67510.1 MAG: 50S ribosomal protein L23 [Candidatus Uhrbacteria bacterium GW2011_GWE2_40_58]